MKKTIIVAYDKDRLIGNGNEIPWRIKEDMEHFKNVTMGHAVIMGRKTYESIPKKFRPLPGRLNIVLTRIPESLENEVDIEVATSTKEALEKAEKYEPKQCIIAGGSEIYKLFLEDGLVDEDIVSKVNGSHEGDVYFPDISNYGVWTSRLCDSPKSGDFYVVKYIARFKEEFKNIAKPSL